jgi:predicted transcriptional regulator
METTLTVRIPIKMKRELEDISQAMGVSKSDIIRESLREYIAVKQFKEVRKMIKPYAERKGILTDEDVFKLMS